jgi:hypothetical protein
MGELAGAHIVSVQLQIALYDVHFVLELMPAEDNASQLLQGRLHLWSCIR